MAQGSDPVGNPGPWFVTSFRFADRQLVMKFHERQGQAEELQLVSAEAGIPIGSLKSLRRAMQVAADKFIAERPDILTEAST